MSETPETTTPGIPDAEDWPFAGLTPERILEALEQLGLNCDGRLLALNSYENRVYRIGMEDAQPVVAKFYRGGRWSDATILEEHAFSLELQAEEIPVVAPLLIDDRSLHQHQGFRFALYPLRNGRAPELEDPKVLRRIGRLLGRLHNVGARRPFRHRASLDPQQPDQGACAWLLENDWVPPHLLPAYASLTRDLLEAIRERFRDHAGYQSLRLHGDAHPGNLLSRDDVLLLVDLDDAINGPAVQDLWLFLAGDRQDQSRSLHALLEGYTEFRNFDPRELGLIEALRSLRIMRHAAWIARRWNDPAFPAAFPWFDSPRYWDEHVLALREQLALVREPPLSWRPD